MEQIDKIADVFKALSEALNIRLKALDGADPQIIGALGAALYAREQAAT